MDISEFFFVIGKWFLLIFQVNVGGCDIFIDGISFQLKFDIFENLFLVFGCINNGKLYFGCFLVFWKVYLILLDKLDDHFEKDIFYVDVSCLC